MKCFKEIDLSKMDSSKMIDASNMFENSSFEEIYFGTENESYTANSEYINESKTAEIQESLNNNSESKTKTRYLDENLDNTQEITEDSEEEKRKEYFDTTKIKSVNEIFMNCRNLKKIQLPPSFNVGKNAKGMFKGCYNLEDVNTSLISSTEIEQMESMFEDCQSLKEISFSNNFLTGEVKSLNNVFKNTNLSSLDLSYLRLFNLENYSNIFDGASIKGSLKIGKYYSNNNTRDNLLKEIAKVTDSNTTVFTPKGTMIDKIFQDIYYNEKNVEISINVVDIDYNIHYKKDENYKIYSNYLHIGLGWDYDENNIYDLDSSILAFNSNINYLTRVNFEQLTAYNGKINLNGDDLTGEGGGDDEEIRISLDSLPSEVQILTVQINSYKGNILNNVKSAYIRLSTETEIIGTYSVNQAGNNIGLLIGCFSKNSTNSWYFKPLNKVIPGHVVTESVASIQAILRNYFSTIDEDVYCQHSGKIGDHLHWCGDPHNPPREGWACPQIKGDGNKCWFCKYGCAVSSYLHFIGKYPNEENIKNCVNDDADMDWQRFGYKYGETPHDNCFGKIKKNNGGTHFVHIMKIYENGECDIFDPNGGSRQGNLNEFQAFIIKDT